MAKNASWTTNALNKKVGNRRTKFNNNIVSYKGLKFDSELECYCYKSLEGNFSFEFQKSIELQPSFERGRAFDTVAQDVWQKGIGILREGKERAITMRVDFFLSFDAFDVIIDTKGFETADWLIKAKMLEFQLAQKEKPTLFFTPKSQQEVMAVVLKLKQYEK